MGDWTPGPWVYVMDPNGRHIILPEGVVNAAPMAQVFTRVLDRNSYPVEANARLIAAAPELLETCKTIIRSYENADAMPEALDMAYAAVNKAKGNT